MSYHRICETQEELYTAFATGASDCPLIAGEFDNSYVMKDILTLRCELASLLSRIAPSNSSRSTAESLRKCCIDVFDQQPESVST